jgi:peptidoglycan/LPS O-acetylase OafA/YrhL
MSAEQTLSQRTRLKQWIYSRLIWLPTLLQTKLFRASAPLSSTAYLDGLRGFSALMVYWMHNELYAHEMVRGPSILENAFGYNKQYYFVCFPGIRTLFSGGHLAVAIFFVLSGYVLSFRPLTLLHDGDLVKFGDGLASALYRRWLRLFVPLIGTSFVFMTLNWLIPGLTTFDSEPKYVDEVLKWYYELKEFSFIFRSGGEPWFSYNTQSWTIALEMKGSIIIYTCLLAFARCGRNARLSCQFGLIFYFLYIVDGWYGSLFVAGMLLCDLDHLAQHNNLPRFLTLPVLQQFKTFNFSVLFILGIFLGGVPSYSSDIQVLRESPGWHYLSFLKPQAPFQYKFFFLSWAAVFVVTAVSHLSILKTFFEMPINQYLGRISFGLYLVHGPILHIFGERIFAAIGWTRESQFKVSPKWISRFPLPHNGPFGLEFSFLASQIALLPFTLWVAKIVTIIFDEPSVRIPKWIYKKVVTSSRSIAEEAPKLY